MAAPSGNYDRVGNFGQVSSADGLKAMHSGEISANSARKIRNAIDWLVASASDKYVYSKKTKRFHKWKLSFLTLTLPTQGNLSDMEVKGILNSFLTLAKYNYGLHSYIWKAEPQARGTIHFHITSDCYMWKNSVRFEWNRLLSKSGLSNGFTNAPSTKIHSTYKLSNVAGYLSKYFLKNRKTAAAPYRPISNSPLNYLENNKTEFYCFNFDSMFYIRPISGRLWGCSHSLSQARSLSYTVDVPEMRALNNDIREAGASEKQKTYCNYFQLPADYYEKLAYGQIKHDYEIHRAKIRKAKSSHVWEVYDEKGCIIDDEKIIRKFVKQIKPTTHGKGSLR